MTNDEIQRILDGVRNLFVAEARAVGDVPILHKHWRNFVDSGWLVNSLIEREFDILYASVGRGMAILNNEDPFVIRVIAQKRERNEVFYSESCSSACIS